MFSLVLEIPVNRTHGICILEQGGCCLDIGFYHMSSAPYCASFRAMHVPCGRRRGNYEMCIYVVRLVYSTVNCILTFCIRNVISAVPLFVRKLSVNFLQACKS